MARSRPRALGSLGARGIINRRPMSGFHLLSRSLPRRLDAGSLLRAWNIAARRQFPFPSLPFPSLPSPSIVWKLGSLRVVEGTWKEIDSLKFVLTLLYTFQESRESRTRSRVDRLSNSLLTEAYKWIEHGNQIESVFIDNQNDTCIM